MILKTDSATKESDLILGAKINNFSKPYKINSRAKGFISLVNRITSDIKEEVETMNFEE